METTTERKQTVRGFDLEIQENPSPEVQAVYDWYEEIFQFVPNLGKRLCCDCYTVGFLWIDNFCQNFNTIDRSDAGFAKK